jgi:nucleoside-diphosphate-sugar epimerase
MNILVLGAGGLVGLNLLALLPKSHKIVALDMDKKRLELINKLFPHVRTVYADLAKKGAWVKEFDTEVVIQLQAQISAPNKQPYIKNNIASVKNVVAACEKHKVKHLIHLSSSVVISVAKDNYSNTKRKGEEIVRESKITKTIFRPPLMYGAFDYKHLGYLTYLMEKSIAFPVPGSGKYLRQPLYVNDMCNIIIKSLNKPTNNVHNIIGKEKINFLDLLKIISKKRKLHNIFVKIPIPLFIGLLKTYSKLTGKKPFVKDQLLALIAGDKFPVDNWDKEFKVKYTSFNSAFNELLKSEYYQYRSGHKE